MKMAPNILEIQNGFKIVKLLDGTQSNQNDEP